MQLPELEHVLRAAAAISLEKSFVLVGSQAVLLVLPNAPAALLVSSEIDLYPALHPEKADLIDGAIGALSTFHDTFGYYAAILKQRASMLDSARYPLVHLSAWIDRRRLEANLSMTNSPEALPTNSHP